MKKKTRQIIIAFLIGIAAILLIMWANMLKSEGAFDPKNPECGVVVKTENIDKQYSSNFSFGIVFVGKGYKSFKVLDYVVEGDTVCKNGLGRQKKDEYLNESDFILFPKYLINEKSNNI